MIKSILIIIFLFTANFSANAFELVKIEADDNFDRVEVWGGAFTDISGEVWDTSEFYNNQNEIYNASLFFKNEIDKFYFLSKIYVDSGYKSALMVVDPLYYISLSANYNLGKNEKIKFVMDPIFKIGGGVTELPCYDDFRRSYHCGTGMAWSDAQSGGFLKKYDQDQSISIYYSVNF